MRYLLRALTLIVIALGFLAIVLLMSGCSTIAPDYLVAGGFHQSEPFRGPHTEPIGDHGARDETTVNGAEIGLRWERGIGFVETDLGYIVQSRNLVGGPWTATVRGGFKVRLR